MVLASAGMAEPSGSEVFVNVLVVDALISPGGASHLGFFTSRGVSAVAILTSLDCSVQFKVYKRYEDKANVSELLLSWHLWLKLCRER